MAETDAALLVADDHQRGETEAPAALHHLGDAIDVHQLVDEFVVALFAVAPRLRGRLRATFLRSIAIFDPLEIPGRLRGPHLRAP